MWAGIQIINKWERTKPAVKYYNLDDDMDGDRFYY